MEPGFATTELSDHVDALYRYAVGVTHDPHLAGDIVQDTFVKALERRDQFRGDAPLGHWLMRIAHRLVLDRVRRPDREVAVDGVEANWRRDSFSVDAAAVVERAAVRDELRDALIRLPYIYRSAVVLHDLEGWRVVDIAAVHDISLPAAKQRLRRGRMALVDALAEGPARGAVLRGVPMHCWDARRHVSDYLDGDLDAETATLIESHLATCPTCPPLYAALVGVHERLGSLRDPDAVIPPHIGARIAELGAVSEDLLRRRA